PPAPAAAGRSAPCRPLSRSPPPTRLHSRTAPNAINSTTSTNSPHWTRLLACTTAIMSAHLLDPLRRPGVLPVPNSLVHVQDEAHLLGHRAHERRGVLVDLLLRHLDLGPPPEHGHGPHDGR